VRGGSFIMGGGCPDGCEAGCLHIGEPLNAAGKRERMTGPSAARVSEKVSYSANFGGMVRMLRTDGPAARRVLRDIRRSDPVADEYISFIHRNYPAVEKNHFSLKEWKEVAEGYGIGCEGGKGAVQEMVRRMPDYMDRMRTMA
ncbi:MAG: hypothetical protein FWH47_07485, partial [Methanomassiliicoccaceae archaeon]|nr:hypothetical protein [Methanomassiliicoccaceae archaeon]